LFVECQNFNFGKCKSSRQSLQRQNFSYIIYFKVISNIKLPPSLLSRFDLIYLMLDNINEAQDRRLASHILTLYSNNYRTNKQVNKFNLGYEAFYR
jgi:DNA replicative helicase MCM subunit Mcm2 (Cdc46/Mcm family)